MTMQSSDMLLWQGQSHAIVTSLDPAAIYPEVAKTNFQLLETSCWRGYEATWIIGDDNYLRIKHMKCEIEGFPNKNVSHYLFEPADQIYRIFSTHDSPVAALSYTGEFTVGSGEWRKEMPYFVSYPIYRVFKVSEGKVTHVEEHDRDWWLKERGIVPKTEDLKG